LRRLLVHYPKWFAKALGKRFRGTEPFIPLCRAFTSLDHDPELGKLRTFIGLDESA
jgi:hypothetical protein